MTISTTTALVFSLLGTIAQQQAGLPSRPRAEVSAVRPSAPVAPGAPFTLTLAVHLPEGIHVQADKPRDPLLIATTLTLTPPSSVKVDRVVFPVPGELVQAGQSKPLLVLGSDFVVEVHATLAPDAPAEEVRIPALLRYQACSERVCFAPARAQAEWVIAAFKIDR